MTSYWFAAQKYHILLHVSIIFSTSWHFVPPWVTVGLIFFWRFALLCKMYKIKRIKYFLIFKHNLILILTYKRVELGFFPELGISALHVDKMVLIFLVTIIKSTSLCSMSIDFFSLANSKFFLSGFYLVIVTILKHKKRNFVSNLQRLSAAL